MKSLAFAFAAMLAAGCASDSGDDYPINPQVSHPTGGATNAVIGRVCVANDLRTLDVCSSSGAGGFTVALGDATTTTAADGTFSFPASAVTSDAMFTVTGTSTTGVSLVPTSAVYSPIAVIPAVDQELYQTLLDTNGVVVAEGTGSILGVVQSNGAGASGVTVTSAPTGVSGPYYASDLGPAWTTGGTGTSTTGAFFIPGLTAGSVDLSYETTLGGQETTVNGVQVRNGGVTVLDTGLSGSVQ